MTELSCFFFFVFWMKFDNLEDDGEDHINLRVSTVKTELLIFVSERRAS